VNRFTQCPLDDPLRHRLKDKCHITGKEVMASQGIRIYKASFPLLNECSGNMALHVADISV